jgi:transcriptional regulator NrdR family protein
VSYVSNPITVIKRDGSKQEYHPDKIIQVLEAAGLEVAQSIQVAQGVTDWIEKQNKSEVTSLEIRDKVIDQLQIVNPQVAGLFRWYQKTKGKS